jgi:NADH:ubiquinone oxidoreductase subunit
MTEFKSINDNYGIKYPEGESIKSIKSKFNSQILSVNIQPVNKITYSLSINDKCLYGYNDDLELKNCVNTNNYMHPQYFEARNINNVAQEKKYMNGKHTSVKIPESYTAFIHKSTQHCLTMDNEGVYLAPCNADNIYQRWQVSSDENICLE